MSSCSWSPFAPRAVEFAPVGGPLTGVRDARLRLLRLGFEAFDDLAECVIERRGVLHHEGMSDAGHQHDLHAVTLDMSADTHSTSSGSLPHRNIPVTKSR